MRIRDRLKAPQMTREAVELGSKETAKKIIEMHKAGKKTHKIATELGITEAQVYRVISEYNRRMSDKGRLGMVSAFGHDKEKEERGLSALKSALANMGFEKG